MISKKYIEDLAAEFLEDSDLFAVKITVSKDNNIRLFIDGDNGVTIDDCVGLSRHIEGNLDRDKEDFELNVSSSGVDQPFVLLRQYKNSLDKKVQVLDVDGKKIRGILKSADENKIDLQEEIKNKNKKIKNISYGEVISIPMERIKETKRIISF